MPFVWELDPLTLLAITVAGWLYANGWQRIHRRGHGRASLPSWRAWAFVGGLASLLLALVSPIAASDGVLFSAHMAQHLLVVLVAAPLLLIGAPVLPLLWGLPPDDRLGIARLFLRPRSLGHRVGTLLTHPFVAPTLFLGSLSIWHIPFLYDLAQGRTLVHLVEHGGFLATALLYWWPVIHPSGGIRNLSYPAAVLYLVAGLLQSNVLGALLTFAPEPLYATYMNGARSVPVSVLEDQQLAGLLMWIPGGLIYLVAIFAVLVSMLRADEQRERAESRTLSPRT